jgi:hypothetical protein
MSWKECDTLNLMEASGGNFEEMYMYILYQKNPKKRKKKLCLELQANWTFAE